VEGRDLGSRPTYEGVRKRRLTMSLTPPETVAKLWATLHAKAKGAPSYRCCVRAGTMARGTGGMPISGWQPTCIFGCVSGGLGSRQGGERGPVPRTHTRTTRWGCCGSNGDRTASRGRKHESWSESRMREIRTSGSNERAVKTEHGEDRRAPADERAGNCHASPKPPRHRSTLRAP
jgi:hypothetical protein